MGLCQGTWEPLWHPCALKEGMTSWHHDFPMLQRIVVDLSATLKLWNAQASDKSDAPIYSFLDMPCSCSQHCGGPGQRQMFLAYQDRAYPVPSLSRPGRRQQQKDRQFSSLCFQSCILGPSQTPARSTS